jgi:hypothetical protein
VDSREGLLRGGETGPAIVPGAPEKSTLVKAVQHADGFRGCRAAGQAAARTSRPPQWIRDGACGPRGHSGARAGRVARARDHCRAARLLGISSARKAEPERPAHRRGRAPTSIASSSRVSSRTAGAGPSRGQTHPAPARDIRSDRACRHHPTMSTRS